MVPLMIISDMKRYKQVLYNLIGNALKFTFKGGITVSLDYDYVTKILSTSVQDTGIGIE
jgi:signal transduction histidine kinase